MTWHDISTAPKDGTVIDLWCPAGPKNYAGRHADCWWWTPTWEGDGKPGWVVRYSETTDNCWTLDAEPSHWMPIPLPPSPPQ